MANQAAVWAAERCPESLHNSRVTTPYQRGAFLDAVQTSIWEMPTQVPAGTTCYHLHRADTLNGTSVTKWILWRIANFAFNTQFFGGVAQNVAYTAIPLTPLTIMTTSATPPASRATSKQTADFSEACGRPLKRLLFGRTSSGRGTARRRRQSRERRGRAHDGLTHGR